MKQSKNPDIQYVYNRKVFITLILFQIEKLKEQLALEDEKAVKAAQERRTAKESGAETTSGSLWNEDEKELLIKAVKLFPAGTNSR
jgi:DnaJ family protein C protein 2